MKRDEKAEVIDELKSVLAGAKTALLADHRGLSVAELTELRNLFRRQRVELRVVKNTLARLATRETELQELGPHLVGPTLIAYSGGDPTVPAKLLASYAKTRPNLKIKAGFVEGKVLARQEALALAELPPREVLLAKLAGVMQSPLRGIVVVLQGPLRSLLIALDAVRQKREKGAPQS